MSYRNHLLQATCLSLLAGSASAQFYEQIVERTTLGANAYFASDVSMHDDIAIVGAKGAVGTEGRGYIYDWDSGTQSWVYRTSVSTGGASANDWYGSAVAIHDGTVVMGAPGGDAGVSDGGEAVVCLPWGSTPIYLPYGILHASDAETNAGFGKAVAVRGDWVFVGAPSQSHIPSLDVTGAVYVYSRNSATPLFGPTQDFKIQPSSGQTGARFGTSLDMSSSYAIVGAPRGGSLSDSNGRAYIYRLSGTTWVTDDVLSISSSEDAGGFGQSVSIYGNYAVVGAPFADSPSGLGNSGVAYVFQRISGNWQQVAKLESPVENLNLKFGFDVAIDDARIVIGSMEERAWVYSRRNLGSGQEWFLSGEVMPTDNVIGDGFGESVAMDGDHFVVGASTTDPNSSTIDGGRAYFYEYPDEFAGYCFTDRGDCPCGNDTGIAGCMNGGGTGGLLESQGSGSISAHDFGLRARQLPTNKTVVLFAGPSSNRAPFANGLLCVSGGIQRLAVKSSGFGGSCTFDSSETIDGLGASAGDLFYYQAWFRDNTGPCGNGSNTTNGVRVRFEG